MQPSDLLKDRILKQRIQALNEVKNYLILNSTGNGSGHDLEALENLIHLVDLETDLKELLENLPFITVDLDGIFRTGKDE
ncbi:hypothetical protein [Gaoshiqia sediminis]|uniref:Uncharacterized protein n=1 Tax=Gaoshiqia sediminis TaxID=2986998 RepID=A0AA42C952_9BACT|nr:hypothetical protein [Gaoshiqia sediminis]MCW0483496.1 hypothetical protein [Gaoshiqia sediminis]